MNNPKLYYLETPEAEAVPVELIEVDERTGEINGGRSHLVKRIDDKSWDAGNNKNGRLSLNITMVRPDQLVVVPEGELK